MFEKIFESELFLATTDRLLAEMMMGEVKTRYSETSRHYHTISHLDHIINELLPIKDRIADWPVLIFSTAYHDIIYDVEKDDNEEKSAELAYFRLSMLSIPEGRKQSCVAQILATKKHQQGSDDDSNYFIDADLAILELPMKFTNPTRDWSGKSTAPLMMLFILQVEKR